MARWRLTSPHYLNVPGIEWEYTEQPRGANRMIRHKFPVPLLLDPKDAGDHNYPQMDAIIVANEASRAYPQDIVFIGEPTPDMEPLDDEAEKISESYRAKWAHPIDSISGNYADGVLKGLETQLAEAIKGAMTQAAGKLEAPNAAVSREEFDAMKSQMAALLARNAELEAAPKARRA